MIPNFVSLFVVTFVSVVTGFWSMRGMRQQRFHVGRAGA
jgi:hypothetical protein